jgi:hypothetical protein
MKGHSDGEEDARSLLELDMQSIQLRFPELMIVQHHLLTLRQFSTNVDIIFPLVKIIHQLHVRYIAKKPDDWLSYLPNTFSDDMCHRKNKMLNQHACVGHNNDSKCKAVVDWIEELLSGLPLYHKSSFCEKLENDLVMNPLPEDDLGNFIVCPITLKIMQDPVMLSDGHCYERVAIVKWLCRESRSPKTNQELKEPLIIFPNHALKLQIEGYIKKHH